MTRFYKIMSIYAILMIVMFTFVPKYTLCADGKGNNCAKIGSCGLPGCKKIRGGSQYVYSNGIPACINKDRDCFDVTCHVKAFTSSDCTDGLLDDTDVDRGGCRAGVSP